MFGLRLRALRHPSPRRRVKLEGLPADEGPVWVVQLAQLPGAELIVEESSCHRPGCAQGIQR